MVLQILRHRHYSLGLSANILKIILLSLLIKIPKFSGILSKFSA